MINFNAGALRPAKDDARLARIAAANDLVQRTLAQHGLLAGSGATAAGGPSARMTMQDLLSRLQTPPGVMGMTDPVVPDGATFDRAQFSCDAGSRAYRTYVPSTAVDGVSGVVVMLHGCTQTCDDFAVGTGMNALAEQHRFVVIYPQQSRGDNAQSCWNWFSRGDQRRDRGEPAILAGLTRKAMAEHGVPRDRTFVAGLSAGGAMAVILGQTYPDVFAAVGVHSGLAFGAASDMPSAFAAMAGNGAQASHPPGGGAFVRTIVFQGGADATVAPANGDQIARHVTDHGPHQTIETDEQGNTAGRAFHRRIVTDCDGAPVLEHWVIDGLGHAWSGGQPQGSYTDAKGPDASAEMVRFFLSNG